MSRLLEKLVIFVLIQLLTVQSVFGGIEEFCLVGELNGRKLVVSHGKDLNPNDINSTIYERDFTFHSSTHKMKSENKSKFDAKMLECLSVRTPPLNQPPQYLYSDDPYYETGIDGIQYFSSYCLVNDDQHDKNSFNPEYQSIQKSRHQILIFYPNKGEGSDDGIVLSLRNLSQSCGTSKVVSANSLNYTGCSMLLDEIFWLDEVCEPDYWKMVNERRNK